MFHRDFELSSGTVAKLPVTRTTDDTLLIWPQFLTFAAGGSALQSRARVYNGRLWSTGQGTANCVLVTGRMATLNVVEGAMEDQGGVGSDNTRTWRSREWRASKLRNRRRDRPFCDVISDSDFVGSHSLVLLQT